LALALTRSAPCVSHFPLSFASREPPVKIQALRRFERVMALAAQPAFAREASKAAAPKPTRAKAGCATRATVSASRSESS